MSSISKPVTRKDVAIKAGVTETIVSYVINNNRSVAKEKKERVLKAIAELNYTPNSIARALKGKKTNHILFIVDDLTNDHFGSLVETMSSITHSKPYLISLAAYSEDEAFIQSVIGRQVDGIVIGSVKNTSQITKRFCDANIPVVVLMNRYFDDMDVRVGKIFTGHYLIFKDIVQRFVNNDRKNLIYIDRVSEDKPFADGTDLRLKGFLDKMKELDLQVTHDTVLTGFTKTSDLYDEICRRVDAGLSFDGVVARHDRLAHVVITALQSRGIKIPHEVAVTGFDNSITSRVMSPSLSSVEINRPLIGQAIIELIDNITARNPDETFERTFKAHYIVRESTGF